MTIRAFVTFLGLLTSSFSLAVEQPEFLIGTIAGRAVHSLIENKMGVIMGRKDDVGNVFSLDWRNITASSLNSGFSETKVVNQKYGLQGKIKGSEGSEFSLNYLFDTSAVSSPVSHGILFKLGQSRTRSDFQATTSQYSPNDVSYQIKTQRLLLGLGPSFSLTQYKNAYLGIAFLWRLPLSVETEVTGGGVAFKEYGDQLKKFGEKLGSEEEFETSLTVAYKF